MASKTDLAKAVAQAERISLKDALSIIDTVLKTIVELTKSSKVTLIGFGSFHEHTTKERQGRNPRTGEAITIPAKTNVRFKPSASLITRQPPVTRQPRQTTGTKSSSKNTSKSKKPK